MRYFSPSLPVLQVIVPKSKSWNLEDDDEDDEDTKNDVMEQEDDEVDPLDAYMQVRVPRLQPSIWTLIVSV